MPALRNFSVRGFTDIVGYTAMMGKDENKAFELLAKNRKIQKPIIEQFNGRWIKEIGDGAIFLIPVIEFTKFNYAIKYGLVITYG